MHCQAVAKVYWVFARVLLIESCLQKNYFAFYTYLEKSSNYIFLLLGTIFSKKKRREEKKSTAIYFTDAVPSCTHKNAIEKCTVQNEKVGPGK